MLLCALALVVLSDDGRDVFTVHAQMLLQISRLTEAPATSGADVRPLSGVQPAMN